MLKFSLGEVAKSFELESSLGIRIINQMEEVKLIKR